MKAPRLILAGGTGFLGRLLSRHFADLGWDVVVLTRAPKHTGNEVREIEWDGATPDDWARELDGAAALINLAGVSVNCRYHARNRRLILESRIHPTRVLGEAIAKCAQPPRVWLNASTATIYKHSFDRAMDEATGEIGATPEAKDAFSVEVARAWEQALQDARTPATRKVALRIAMVLGAGRNSVFPVLRRLARLGLGGRMGNGKQFVSWIHEQDFCRGIEWLIARNDLSGPVNLAAPNPITNTEMMRMMRRLCGATFGLPAARWMLEVGAFFLRTETELIIKSRRVTPRRLLTSGFRFRFESFEAAASNLEQRMP
ncbi:MAG TPA: TIGR01777 family oxidoreductase [Verrucomicrobiae bacterium]|nr:TIGR01777 family oxidoreductase [Verrucomicrobiae bacterium]